jgi:hypothetical protein
VRPHLASGHLALSDLHIAEELELLEQGFVSFDVKEYRGAMAMLRKNHGLTRRADLFDKLRRIGAELGYGLDIATRLQFRHVPSGCVCTE